MFPMAPGVIAITCQRIDSSAWKQRRITLISGARIGASITAVMKNLTIWRSNLFSKRDD